LVLPHEDRVRRRCRQRSLLRLQTVDCQCRGADGSGLTQLGAGAGTTGSTVRSPVWSPQGDRIAFTNWDINSGEYVPYCPGPACDAVVYIYCSASPSVYVMNSDGTNMVPVATGYDDAWRPASAGGTPLVAAFTYVCSDVTCTFDASTSQGAASYAWSFGDGTSGSGRIAPHIYPRAMPSTTSLSPQSMRAVTRG
jgi:PKD repeat protein